MNGNYPIQCALEASQQNLLMGGTWGKGKQREEAEMAPGESNREGAIISVLITIDHQLLAPGRREGGGKCGWRRKRKACLKLVLKIHEK